MILKELLEHASAGTMFSIVSRLLDLYPNQKGNADAYFIAVGELLSLEPGDPDGFSLHITMETEPGLFDDPDDFKPWAHVFGKNGDTQRDTDEDGYLLPDDPTPEQLEWYDTEATWAMELSAWEDLLAMEVVTEIPLLDALSHILWEITFFGYSNAKVKERDAQFSRDYEDMREERDA